jgi:DNA polymerase-3 subunit gamma/tau
MEHISLYRKWRPQTFGEVVGQRHVTNTLANALSSGRLVHAYLFSGPRGTGKTSTARILAKAINCVEGPTATPCNVCEACVSISEGTALDVIEIDAASNRKIDEIRDLLDKIPYTPTLLRSKVYIIDEVHQLTPEASSALLKTLEEPPGHVVFVLATTEPHKLLPTIVSRCQRFDFSLVQAQEVSRLLEHIASSEGIDVEAEALEMIAEHAHGSVRDAIGVMDQVSNLSGDTVTTGLLAELLGEVETELVSAMVGLLAERDTPGALALVGDLVEAGKDPRRFVESLISHLRSMFLIQNAANPGEIVEATSEHFERLTEQSTLLSRHEVIKLMERLGETHREMRWSENPRLVLECAVVKNTSLDADVSLEGLAFRIEELERKIDALGPAAGGGEAGGDVRTPARRSASGTQAGPSKRAGGQPKAKAGAGRAKGDAVETAPPVEQPVEGVAAGARGHESAPAAESGTAATPQAPDLPRAATSDREKVRRAWMAVMGDLKKMGQMKLYALLTKVRVQGVKGQSLVLGFPEDAVFQMEVLSESAEDLGVIEATWERFVGEPVKVKLVSIDAGPGREVAADPPANDEGDPAAGADGGGQPGPARAPVESAAGVEARGGGHAETREGEPPAAGPDDDAEGPEKRKKADPNEIARLLKERFDGEIIEPIKEGKD